MSSATIVFDGVCNLCNGAVDFVVRRDRQRIFRFAPLQTEASKRLLQSTDLEAPYPDSIVLIEGHSVYVYSEAVIRVARRLGFPWNLATAGYLVPRSWRDALYRRVASSRYRWFGRRDSCRIPSAEEQDRFIV